MLLYVSCALSAYALTSAMMLSMRVISLSTEINCRDAASVSWVSLSVSLACNPVKTSVKNTFFFKLFFFKNHLSLLLLIIYNIGTYICETFCVCLLNVIKDKFKLFKLACIAFINTYNFFHL